MDKYQILGKIASGAFGTVYDAEVLSGDLEGQVVAIKKVYVTDIVKRQLELIACITPHPNVVKCHQIVTENDFEKNIVMEKGVLDLDHYIESIEYPISEEIVRVVAKGVLEGLAHLHSLNIIHRDLKPSNIVIKQDNKNVAICDFGSAIQVKESGEFAIEGFTRWYKCPEMLFGSRNYRYEVDIWSLGCILFELATGQQLFAGKTELQQLALISNFLGDPSPDNWPSIVNLNDYGKIQFVKKPPKSKQQIHKQIGISEQLTEFLLKMIRYEGRLSAKQLLQDKYLQNVNEHIFEKGPFCHKKIVPKLFKD